MCIHKDDRLGEGVALLLWRGFAEMMKKLKG